MSILLIHPPLSKSSEPPAGIARLRSALQAHGVGSSILDLNLEGALNLMEEVRNPSDTWTRRALRKRSHHLACLRSESGYQRLARYQGAVRDLNRLLQVAGRTGGAALSLANYQHQNLSPVKSRDLIRAAERFEEDPFYPYFSRRLREAMEADPPAAVGLSLNYLNQALCTFSIVGFLKKNFPPLKIVLGGGLVTSWVRRPGWRNPFGGLADSLIAGRGEAPLLSLLNVKGSLKTFDFPPEYDPFPLDDYLAPGMILPYSASGGCYWGRCLFCPERAEGTSYQPVAPRQVIQDLRDLVAKRRPVLIHLLDNAVSPGLLRELAGQRFGAPWYGFARITEQLADPEFCLALKDSGCVMLQLGLESGDQGVLDRLQKGVDLGVASQAFKNLKRAGIAPYVYLLFGTPAEGEAEARRTLEFAVRHSGEIGFLNLAIFNLPAYGEEAGNLSTRDFYEGDLSLYSSFVHPRGWNRDRVRSFLEKEFKRHPAISPIVKRDPPIFTSNHAPFFSGRAVAPGA